MQVLVLFPELKLQYSHGDRVVIKVPKATDNPLCGLCGNNNGNPEDDMVSPGKLALTNSVEFGNSWQDKAEIRGELHIDSAVLNAAQSLKLRDAVAVSVT
jgi:hypothetical protein